jgi:hypothetical protein
LSSRSSYPASFSLPASRVFYLHHLYLAQAGHYYPLVLQCYRHTFRRPHPRPSRPTRISSDAHLVSAIISVAVHSAIDALVRAVELALPTRDRHKQRATLGSVVGLCSHVSCVAVSAAYLSMKGGIRHAVARRTSSACTASLLGRTDVQRDPVPARRLAGRCGCTALPKLRTWTRRTRGGG